MASASLPTLFTLPIIPSPDAKPIGSITCQQPSKGVYLLIFGSAPDNRLLSCFCQTFLLALDILEFEYPTGVVITTSAIPKFYSNGLDLEHATTTDGFLPNSLWALFKRLITYPMPTIALINGHAFAGGFMLAMYHDYRIFSPTRGFLCINELEFGVPLLPPMSSIFRQKLDPSVYKAVVLEAKRWNGKDALENRIVDGLGGLDEALTLVKERKLTLMGKTGIYGTMKEEMFKETLGYLASKENAKLVGDLPEEEVKRRDNGKRRVAEWKKSTPKPKL
ncbi:hypothetical protein HYFRA_00002503 [Hymenoscyphus fraxineus]|uniref:Uncharacterized protein n=1 Tax=Hymenoscyphus fraxineus TaxID=746836 RepID=A0A9N9PZ21_9HELO|nr:hypothetical protein HYFRA_00002503 [Hymenoscyphus fraxineus]